MRFLFSNTRLLVQAGRVFKNRFKLFWKVVASGLDVIRSMKFSWLVRLSLCLGTKIVHMLPPVLRSSWWHATRSEW